MASVDTSRSKTARRPDRGVVFFVSAHQSSSNSNETYLFMDLRLINAAREGDVDGLKQLHERVPNILHQVTPVRNTVLHLAAKFGHPSFLVEVCNLSPSLITKRNIYEDTALHVGARAGHLPVVNHLIDRMSSCPLGAKNEYVIWTEYLVGSQNEKGDSALHEALRYGRRDVAKLLIEKHPDLCLLENKALESPLYLAVIKVYIDVVDQILHSSPSAAWHGPNQWTVLHACTMVKEEGLGFYMAEKVLQVMPGLARQWDFYGRTPLHYAVDMNKPSIVKLLLQHDPSIAYDRDTGGWTPLHVAAYQSYEGPLEMSIVEDIIHYCPDLEYLIDIKGNNVLHVLIERMDQVIEEDVEPYSDQIFRKLALEELVNQPNDDGNTPLHLATLYKREYFKGILLEDARVDKKARNNNNLTASDIARYQDYKPRRQKDITHCRKWSEIGLDVSPNDQSLLFSQPRLWIETLKPQVGPRNEEDAEPKPHLPEVEHEDPELEARKNLSGTHMLVAMLIAAVAFGAALQMPGGNESSGDKKGMAVLAGEAAFGAFVISAVTAFLCSVLTLMLYFFVEVANYNQVLNFNESKGPTEENVNTSLKLILVAIVAMTVAFMCGVFAVLVRTHSLWIGIFTLVVCLGGLFFSFSEIVGTFVFFGD